jgi:phage shock protein E
MTSTAATSHVPDDWIVSHDELVDRLRDPSFLLVDALGPESYVGGHIPGAVNLPLGDLRELARTALPDLDREIAVYCSSFT